MEQQHIGIVGAGTMGRGIALACLQHGYRVTLSDAHQTALDSAARFIEQQLDSLVAKQRISATQAHQARSALVVSTSLDIHRDAALIIESIIEDRQRKVELYSALEERISPTTVLASNTSSISINALAAGLVHPERFVGIHFFNPAYIMKLVEVIPSLYTNPDTVASACSFAERLGKVPIVVRDVPGFLVNRVVRNYYNEAQRIVTEGVATIEQVDRLLEAVGFRMGPFRLMDLIGVDTNLSVTQSVYEQYFYEPRFQPQRLQQAYVDAGLHGRKSGRGFYSYDQSAQ
jgi:3-hydroxybutyryl-CoA dehydrogenase